MSECALICIISFLSFFPSQFSAPFCPEKLSNFLFLAAEQLPCWSKTSFFSCAFLLRPRGQTPWQVTQRWHRGWLGSSRSAVINCSAREGMPGPSRPPSAPSRRSGPRHTQSACVRRHKPASKEPTKQRSRLPLPNIMSLCSACLFASPAAQARHSAFSFKAATSAGGFLPGKVAFCATVGCDAQPQMGWGLALPLCSEQGATWLYHQAACPCMFWGEVAALVGAEQQEGGQEAAQHSKAGPCLSYVGHPQSNRLTVVLVGWL